LEQNGRETKKRQNRGFLGGKIPTDHWSTNTSSWEERAYTGIIRIKKEKKGWAGANKNRGIEELWRKIRDLPSSRKTNIQ